MPNPLVPFRTAVPLANSFLYTRNYFSPGDAGTKELSDDELGILTEHPSNPQFAIEGSRIESFKHKWPSNLAQTPDTLSSAGFYYVGEFTIGPLKLKH